MNYEDPGFGDHSAQVRTVGTDWHEYYHALRKRLWVVILCFALGAAGAALYLNGQHRVYRARAVLFFQQEQGHVLNKIEGVHDDRIENLDMVNTVVDVLRGYPFAERVAIRLKLANDPRFAVGLEGHPAPPVSVNDAATYLSRHVLAAYRPRTRLIDIYITHPSASMATDLANAYAEEYIRFGFDQRTEANKSATQSLQAESELLKKQLRISEEAMQSFREQEKAISLENSQQSTEHKLEEYSRRLTDLEGRIFQLDSDLQAANATPGDVDALLRLPSVSQEPKVSDINQAIADAERQFAVLKQRYRSRHPSYVALQTQLASLYKSREQILRGVVDFLSGERARLRAQYEGMKNASAEQEAKLLAASGKTVQYNDLKREVETNRAMSDSILGRITEIEVATSKGMTDSQVRIHEMAASAQPVIVNVPEVYVLGALSGLLAGSSVVLGRYFLDQSFTTVDQVEQLSGAGVLAAIPQKARNDPRSVDVISEREGQVAESFRSLRTSVTARDKQRRVFLFTSAAPSEGKTFCSTNFAASLGQQGFRTLLIDADLRQPMVSNVYFGESRQPGLSDILSSKVGLSAGIHPSVMENLDILPAGTRPPNPAELLADPRLAELLEEVLASYQRVVIDTPPVLAVSDSLLIAPHADVTCLVLRAFKTPRKTFLRSLKSLNDIHCRPAGIVFNFLPRGARNHYYYSGRYHVVYGARD